MRKRPVVKAPPLGATHPSVARLLSLRPAEQPWPAPVMQRVRRLVRASRLPAEPAYHRRIATSRGPWLQPYPPPATEALLRWAKATDGKERAFATWDDEEQVRYDEEFLDALRERYPQASDADLRALAAEELP